MINLQGRVYMANTDCPFRKADELLAAIPSDVKVRFVDFHAEVTSEKMAMGWYLDGRVSAMVGTHTHIPTADTRILPGGTGYQTDCGMTGPFDSVIGVEKDPILRRFLTALPVKMEPATGSIELHSVIMDVDDETGKTREIKRHTVRGDLNGCFNAFGPRLLCPGIGVKQLSELQFAGPDHFFREEGLHHFEAPHSRVELQPAVAFSDFIGHRKQVDDDAVRCCAPAPERSRV